MVNSNATTAQGMTASTTTSAVAVCALAFSVSRSSSICLSSFVSMPKEYPTIYRSAR